MTPPVAAAASLTPRRLDAAFWCVAYAFLVTMAFSTVPAPLYPIYSRENGFGPLTVTVVFAVYALGVIASLLLAGHVSDWMGRRRVLVPSVILSLASAAVFIASTALPWLIVARVLSGLSVGLMTATATAWITELHGAARPSWSRARADRVATAANLGGLGLGAFVSGVVATHAAEPLRIPYVVGALLLALGLVVVLRSPETVPDRRPWPRWRPQRVSVPHESRGAFVTVALMTVTSFAIFGLFTSLAPAVLRELLGSTSPTVAGATTLLVFGTATLAQLLAGSRPATLLLRFAVVATGLGVVVIAVAVWNASLAGFLVGGALAGVGGGVGIKASISTTLTIAHPDRRGETLAGLFLAGYLGLTVPVVGLGLGVQVYALRDAVAGFALVLLAALAVVGIRLVRRDPLSSPGPGSPPSPAPRR